MSRYSTVLIELQTAKARLAELEQKREERAAQLRALPQAYGYKDLNEFIRALRAHSDNGASPTRHRATDADATPREIIKPAEPAKGMNKALTEMVASPQPPPPAPEAAKVESAAPAPKLPTGTSLDDPVNFGLMPDNSLLENSTNDQVGRRIQLTKSLEFARNVLHTSKVPAAVWREWRNFERRGVELLKGESPAPAPLA